MAEARGSIRVGGEVLAVICGSGYILRRGVSPGDSYPWKEPPLWTQGL